MDRHGRPSPPSPRAVLAELGDPDWIVAVGQTWAAYEHLIPSPNPLVMRVQRWRQTHRLTAADWAAVGDRLLAPEVEAKVRYAGDLFAELAAAVLVVARKRDEAERAARHRAMLDGPKASAEDLAKLRAVIGGIGGG